MSVAEDLRANYAAVRRRLDRGGIDLKRKPVMAAVEAEPTPEIYDAPLLDFDAFFRSDWLVVRKRDNVEVVVEPPIRYPTIRTIQKIVAFRYSVSVMDILSARRTANVVLPRQVGIYFCKKLTPASYPAVGRHFGGRDHTTALHSFNKIKMKRETDEELSADLDNLECEIMATVS